MPLIKKLSKHGSSLALVIEKPIMQILDWEPGQELEMTTDGKRLFIYAKGKTPKRLTKYTQEVNL